MTRLEKENNIAVLKGFIQSDDFHISYLKTFFGMGLTVESELAELIRSRDFFETWLRVNPSWDNPSTTVELQQNANVMAVTCRLKDINQKITACKALKALNDAKVNVQKLLF